MNMKKKTILLILLILVGNYIIAQKRSTSLELNAGTTLPLTESSFYKPGIYLGAIFSYGVRSEKNDALTFGAGYHTFKNKKLTSDVVKMMDIKAGFRFFPSSKTPIYLHPNVGIGFFADGSGGKANPAAGLTLGYSPKIGTGNLNVFAAYNKMSFSSGLNLLNLGIGYQFNFKAK